MTTDRGLRLLFPLAFTAAVGLLVALLVIAVTCVGGATLSTRISDAIAARCGMRVSLQETEHLAQWVAYRASLMPAGMGGQPVDYWVEADIRTLAEDRCSGRLIGYAGPPEVP